MAGNAIACRLCGRDFVPRRGGPLLYCAPCMARVAKETASAKRVECKKCGKAFSTHNLAVRYCSDACRKGGRARRPGARGRTVEERAGATAKCRMCGKKFPSPSRVVRYCSDACRKEGYARYGHTKWQPRPPRSVTARCRACGKGFATDMGPGKLRAYCSDPCRIEGERARNREYMRRYFADPEKRAVQAVRVRASAAKRRAARKRGGGGSR